MNGQDDDWVEEPGPADDDRVLHGRADAWHAGLGALDYAAAITTRDDAWWAGLSEDDAGYAILRALESASERGAPLHLARCPHHLQDLLSGLEAADRAWMISLLRQIGGLLARRTGSEQAVTFTTLLAYLAAVGTDPRFAPPPAPLSVGLLHHLYPHGVSPADLQESLDRERYPHGKPLPACPVCEPWQVDPSDALAQAVAALAEAQRAILVRLGQALALDADAPELKEQVAWVRGSRPVPARYHGTLAEARVGGDVTLEGALQAAR